MRTQLILLIALSSPAFAQGSNIQLSDLGLRLADLKREVKVYDDAVKERDQFDKDMEAYDAKIDEINSSVYSAYVADCPNGFPAEQRQACDAEYAAYSSEFDQAKAQYNAAKAQSEDAGARITASVEKMKPIAATLWAAFPECRTVTPIENSVMCLEQFFDAAGRKGAIAAAPQIIPISPYALAGKDPRMPELRAAWQAKSEEIGRYRDQLKTLESQPYTPELGAQIIALRETMDKATGELNALSQNVIQLNPGAIAGGQAVQNGPPPTGGAPKGDTTLQRLQSMGRGQVSLGSGFENRNDNVIAVPPKGTAAAPPAPSTRPVSSVVAADPGYRAAEQAMINAAKDEAAAQARINQLKAKQATEDSNQRQLDQIEISRQEQARQAAKSAERTAEIRRDAAQKRVEVGAPEIVPASTARRN